MSRKVLISPGYGAGWVSWHFGSDAERRFMLEYRPFIDLIAGGKSIGEPALAEFRRAFAEAFPSKDLPYEGGVERLQVRTVPTGSRVRVTEYDGSESLDIEGSEEGWL